MQDDRMVYGTWIGLAGAAVQNLYGLLGKLAGFTGPVYWDYGKIIVLSGRNMNGVLATLLGIAAHLVWDTILGIVFVYLVRDRMGHQLTLKGITYGAAIWFFVRAIALLYRIPIFISVSPQTVLFFFIGSIFFGIVVACSLRFLYHRVERRPSS